MTFSSLSPRANRCCFPHAGLEFTAVPSSEGEGREGEEEEEGESEDSRNDRDSFLERAAATGIWGLDPMAGLSLGV